MYPILKKEIQFSEFYVYPDGSPSQLIRIVGVVIYVWVSSDYSLTTVNILTI
jgi:hypothetical protein